MNTETAVSAKETKHQWFGMTDDEKVVDLGMHPDFDGACKSATGTVHWIFREEGLRNFIKAANKALNPPVRAPKTQVRDALEKARSFIEGFEGDESQEGIDEMLKGIDACLAAQPTQQQTHLYLLDYRSHAAVLAGLRLLQNAGDSVGKVIDIATNGGMFPALDAGQIDALIDSINNHGLSASEATDYLDALGES